MGALSRSPRLAFVGLDPAPKLMGRANDTSALDGTVHHRNNGQFHLFPLLPPELRLKIWNLNLPTWRLVPLRCGAASLSPHERQRRPVADTTGCTSIAPIPVNLHVSAESRAEAFKSYRRAFGFARGPGQVIFSPDSDVLLFGPREGYMAAVSQFHTCMAMCDQAELARVRRVAISDSLFWIDDTYSSMTASSLSVDVIRQLATRMPCLERIIFVPREDEAGGLGPIVERMARQIQMAMASVGQQVPHWRPPPWEIVCMSSLATTGG